MNGSRAKQLRSLARMIATNPAYQGVPYKVILKDLTKKYKENKKNGIA